MYNNTVIDCKYWLTEFCEKYWTTFWFIELNIYLFLVFLWFVITALLLFYFLFRKKIAKALQIEEDLLFWEYYVQYNEALLSKNTNKYEKK